MIYNEVGRYLQIMNWYIIRIVYLRSSIKKIFFLDTVQKERTVTFY